MMTAPGGPTAQHSGEGIVSCLDNKCQMLARSWQSMMEHVPDPRLMYDCSTTGPSISVMVYGCQRQIQATGGPTLQHDGGEIFSH
jgi:hypothetical protein